MERPSGRPFIICHSATSHISLPPSHEVACPTAPPFASPPCFSPRPRHRLCTLSRPLNAKPICTAYLTHTTHDQGKELEVRDHVHNRSHALTLDDGLAMAWAAPHPATTTEAESEYSSPTTFSASFPAQRLPLGNVGVVSCSKYWNGGCLGGRWDGEAP